MLLVIFYSGIDENKTDVGGCETVNVTELESCR